MAHDLYMRSSTDAAMMYVGEVPWHGLGKSLPSNATYQQACDVAGFYPAEERELYVPGRSTPIPDRKAIVRGDTGEYLSTVGKDYAIVQFADMAETIITAAGGVQAIFHTAGLLGPQGAKGWLLGELPNPIKVLGDKSEIRKYFLAYSGHDGMTACTLANVATRVVCANTVGAALSERNNARWTIRHTKNAAKRVEEAGQAFRNLTTGYEQFGQLANTMAKLPFSDAQMVAVLDRVLPMPSDGKTHPRTENNRATVRTLAQSGAGMDGIRGTAWGAFQALTEYADHHASQRLSAGTDRKAARLESVWMGSAATFKQESLTALASVGGFSLPHSA